MNRKLTVFITIALIVSLLIVPHLGISGYMIRLLAIIFLWIGKTGCWNIVAGYTGYIDFGAVGYFGIGSYATALLMAKAHVPFLAAILIGGVVSGLVAIPIGLPTLQIKRSLFRHRNARLC